jgi:hypothetical protein
MIKNRTVIIAGATALVLAGCIAIAAAGGQPP